MSTLDHEQLLIRTGPRSGLPVIVAVHSSTPAQAATELARIRLDAPPSTPRPAST